ncbi:MAG TPA: alpha/beta hydrolase [Thermoanaerobaculia bacterium]
MPQKSTIGRTVALSSLRAGFAAANAISPELAAAGAVRLFMSTHRHPVPARERAGLQGARRAKLASEWGPLAAQVWGERGTSTVALLHGWEGRASQLGAFAPPLVAAGFRVVGLDAPGHGDSPGRSSSLVIMAGALRALGERYGPFSGIVAHSAGTVAAVHALSRGLAADRLVCVAPGVDLEGYAGEFARLFGLSAGAHRGLKRRIERRVGVSFGDLDPRRAAAGLRIPLLVIHDRADREAPFAGGEALARAWPGARFLATEGLGHTRILWDESVVAAATEFLRDGSARPVMKATGSDLNRVLYSHGRT